MTVILYALLLAHLSAYKQQYMNIGITFAVSYIMKRLIKSLGNKEHAELIGLAGYSLTVSEIFKLIGAIKKSGIQGANSEEANKFIGGILGKGIDGLIDLFKK